MVLRPHLIYNGSSGRAGLGIPSRLFVDDIEKPHGASHYSIVWVLPRIIIYLFFMLQLFYHFLRLHALSIPMLYRHDSKETLGEWTKRTTPSNFFARILGMDNAWSKFVDEVVVPLFSAVCTATSDDVYRHPVNEILGEHCVSTNESKSEVSAIEYVLLTLGTNHYVVQSGVQDAVLKITSPIPASNIHLSSFTTSVESDPLNPSTAQITFNCPDGESIISGFDHVILATQANNAVPILSTLRTSYPAKSPLQRATDAQIACLRRFPYVQTIVVNHRDESFLPANKYDTRDLNLVCAPGGSALRLHKSDPLCLPPGYTMATHVVPQKTRPPVGNPSHRILQTTNPIYSPHPDSIISIARIERALVSTDSKEAQKDLIAVGVGRWKLIWNSAGGAWLPFRLEFARPRKLGRLQAPGRLTPLIASDGDKLPPGVWLCGSYAHPGIPLLEACVTSALAVVEGGIFEIEGVGTRASWAIRA
jgi:hypothetical protein